MTTVLALDLGTTTGFSIQGEGFQADGTWNLQPGRFDGGGMRFVKLLARLNEVHEAAPVDQVVFEEVRRHAGTTAAQIYGGLMATVTAWCEQKGIPYTAASVGSIKKAWVGKGNASKEDMIAEATRRGHVIIDDNHADALAIQHWFRENYKHAA